jgi:LytS/YehU family sensor histidine kinase
VAALTQTLSWYRRSRARELELARMEAQLAQARLDALTAQIRPHFLFNTLHTIGQLWRSGHAEEADAMLDHLGALFQRVQASTSRTLVSLDEELETVEAYLAIEAARFRDRMRVHLHIDDAARGCAVPPLLLQPIVENAVRHGIAVSPSAGHITVRGRVLHDRLVLDVEDDGPGMSGNGARSGGTGLSNTRERLTQLFGSDHRLDIGSADGRGTRVRIDLPVRVALEADDAQPRPVPGEVWHEPTVARRS